MMLKCVMYSLIVLLIFFTSCYSTKDIVVKLSPTEGLSEMGETHWQAQPIVADSTQTAYAKKLGLDSFIVTRFLHRPWEQYYFDWKEGKLDSIPYVTSLSRYAKDPVTPKNLPKLDGESLFLFGKKVTGEYVVVADENNNNTFTDDFAHSVIPIKDRFKHPSTADLPQVRIRNLQGFSEGRVFTFSTAITLRPTIIIDTANARRTNFYLPLVSKESFTGKFRYRGKRFKIVARNTHFPTFSDREGFISVKFAEAREDSAFLKQWNTRAGYRSGDTLALQNRVFRIKRVSPLPTRITLQPLRISPDKVTAKSAGAEVEPIAANQNGRIGKPYLAFNIKGDTASITSESLQGNVLFINFWFAACPPCIAEFEALSDLYNKLANRKNFKFISFTFESPEVVEKVRQKYSLTFPIYTIRDIECQRLNFGNGYPTNIIVDKQGIVQAVHVGGATSKQEAKAFIDKEIYTKILQVL